MFISLLLLIPWIKFGFENADCRFLGLTQTKKSLGLLLILEVTFFLTLLFFLGSENFDVAGSGSFSWQYSFYYAKGILPTFVIAESIHPNGGDIIDREYCTLFFLTALMMDYIILKIISPRTMKMLK